MPQGPLGQGIAGAKTRGAPFLSRLFALNIRINKKDESHLCRLVFLLESIIRDPVCKDSVAHHQSQGARQRSTSLKLDLTSWCTRDRQGRHPVLDYSLPAFDSVGLPKYHQQMVESGRSLSDSQPSYDIRNDPSPVVLHFDLVWDRQRLFHSTTALAMAMVEYTPEAVL
jgi:hypothetical protein